MVFIGRIEHPNLTAVSSRRAMFKRFNITKDDVDLFEINEAFGSMYAYCVETMGLDIEKVNVNGGAM